MVSALIDKNIIAIVCKKREMERETIFMDGFKFHRYPESKKLTDRRYFKGWINIGGHWKKTSVHRYIWEKVNGKIPKGFAVHHINSDFADNRIENLHLSVFLNIWHYIMNYHLKSKRMQVNVSSQIGHT